MGNTYIDFGYDDKTEIITFANLDPETTYYGEAVIYIAVYDAENYGEIRCYEKRIKLPAFTTKKNEISDISGIDWKKLVVLKELHLDGNEITKLPDFKNNICLERVGFEENLLSDEEVKTSYGKFPVIVTFII